MKRIYALMALACASALLMNCTDNQEDNNATENNSTMTCTAAPACAPGFMQVDACPSQEDCEEVTACAQTIYCVADTATCTAVPVCAQNETEVDACPEGSTCREVSECEQTITCAEMPPEPMGCTDEEVWVNACETWDTSCRAYEGPGTPGFCKPFTPPAYPIDACDYEVSPGDGSDAATTNLLTAFIEAEAGELICLKNGYYEVKEQLPLAAGVEVRGETMEGVILDFANQVTGANGILAQPGPGESVVFTQLTVKNTSGDGIRVEKADGVTFRHVTATWDGGPDKENGAYGLYPVQSTNVLIESCKAYNAADAGIYVGQSTNIIVRDSEAAYNVAGVEIENSSTADVYNNDIHDNTGGLLVFNLPNLDIKGGSATKVHDNAIVNNNTKNFAPEGNIVALVPTGTGIMVLAADDAEIHDNTVKDNQSVGIGIFSYQSTQREDYKEDDQYDPYSERNYIHDNVLGNNGYDTARGSVADFIRLLSQLEVLEDLLWDGFVNAELTVEARKNCWKNNTYEDGSAAAWRNFWAPGLPNDISQQTTELGEFDCEGTTLPAVTLPDAE